MQVKINTEQKVHVKLNPVDAIGKAAVLDGPATFTKEDGSDIEVVTDEDGLGATILSGTTVGKFNVTVTADRQIGEQVDNIVDTIEVEVTNPLATALGIVAEEPVLKEA